jgi:hypothetical protein
LSHASRLITAAALALLACPPAHGQAVAAGDRIRVEAHGPGKEVVRLVDDRTGSVIASDRLAGEGAREARVLADNTMVVVRRGHNADGSGDGLCAYAVDWTTDPATGAKTGKVTQVLVFRPDDGHLALSLEAVPNGVVLRVRTGLYVPPWNKTFFYRRANATWYEWPKTFRPGYPDDALPAKVATTRTNDPYDAYLRAPEPGDE